MRPEMALDVRFCAPKPMATPLTPPTASSGWMLSPNACSLCPPDGPSELVTDKVVHGEQDKLLCW